MLAGPADLRRLSSIQVCARERSQPLHDGISEDGAPCSAAAGEAWPACTAHHGTQHRQDPLRGQERRCEGVSQSGCAAEMRSAARPQLGHSTTIAQPQSSHSTASATRLPQAEAEEKVDRQAERKAGGAGGQGSHLAGGQQAQRSPGPAINKVCSICLRFSGTRSYGCGGCGGCGSCGSSSNFAQQQAIAGTAAHSAHCFQSRASGSPGKPGDKHADDDLRTDKGGE